MRSLPSTLCAEERHLETWRLRWPGNSPSQRRSRPNSGGSAAGLTCFRLESRDLTHQISARVHDVENSPYLNDADLRITVATWFDTQLQTLHMEMQPGVRRLSLRNTVTDIIIHEITWSLRGEIGHGEGSNRGSPSTQVAELQDDLFATRCR